MSLSFLVIEDNPDDAFMIRRAFSGSACQPFVCRNTSEARAYLLGAGMYQNRNLFPFPSVVVSDIRLGEESGIHFLSWLRSNPDFSELPVVILSGVATPKEIALAKKLGAAKILTKPSDPVALHDLLVHLLRNMCPEQSAGRRWPGKTALDRDEEAVLPARKE